MLLVVLAPAGPGHGTAASAATRAKAGPLTVPGRLGTPQPPSTVFSEDFENRGPVPVRLTSYAGATGMTYTADPPWRQNCNGWVAAYSDPGGANAAVAAQVADCTPRAGHPGSPGATAWNNVRLLAQALGIFNGSATPNANHAVSAYTNGPVNNGDPGAGYTEFQTVKSIPIKPNGRFLTMSVNAAEMSCAANKNHALLDFDLVTASGTFPVTSAPVDPCTGGGVQIGTSGIYAGTFTGNSPLLTDDSVVIKMVNQQASGNGNDHAFDDITLVDVTPQLDKTFSPPTVQVGGTSTLTFTITNTSDLLPKSGWSFTDTLPAGLTLATPSAAATTCPAGTVTAPDGGTSVGVTGGALGAGQASCTVTVKVTSATVGGYVNDATNITSEGLNPPGSSTVDFTSTPAIDLVKSVSPGWFSAAGQALHYSFLVTNPSTVPLSAVAVADTGLPGLSPISCPSPTLAPGTSQTCTATYTTTTADVQAGSIANTATATGTPPTGPPVTDTSSATVRSVADAITLAKSARPGSYDATGQVVTFDYLVTNTSDVPMSSITVNDTSLPGLSPVTCPQPDLGPDESEHCFATYPITAADLDAGSVANTATAQGNPPGSITPVVSGPATATVPAVQHPAITVVKSASPATFSRVGQAIAYSYLVTNAGNVTLTGVGVTDDLSGLSAVSCPDATLAAGAGETCSATYIITAADVRAGQVTNTATAHGDPPGSVVPMASFPSTAIVPAENPAITVVKSASPATYDRAGQAIAYSYRVTNTGNVTLTSVGVTDDLAGLPAVTCPDPTLAAGAHEDCSATYTITAADLDAGQVTNTATAHGDPPGSATPVVSSPSAATVKAVWNPAITVVKSASPAIFDHVGQPISYFFLVINTGNVTLTGVGVTDTLARLSGVTCPAATLAVGARETCSATYTITAADVHVGAVINAASVHGNPPGSKRPVGSPDSTAIVAAERPAITLVKSARPATFHRAGQVIAYTYRVTNTGNVTLTSVRVRDDMAALSPVACPATTLAVGAHETCTFRYTTTAADLNAGQVTNTATAEGVPPGPAGPVTSRPATATVRAVRKPAITLRKSATPAFFDRLGQAIQYRYRVTNTGNVTLSDVAVHDRLRGLSAVRCPRATLAARASETCTATYYITRADLRAGAVTNRAVAAGIPPGSRHPVHSLVSVVKIRGRVPVTGLRPQGAA